MKLTIIRIFSRTNITEPAKRYNTSRGHLVSSFLLSESSHSVQDEVTKNTPKDAKFAGFNLLLLAPTRDSNGSIEYDSLFVTNHGGGGTFTSRPLSSKEHSCGGISNGIDGAGADLWPKVQHATEDFDVVVHQNLPSDANKPPQTEPELVEQLFQLLTCVFHHYYYLRPHSPSLFSTPPQPSSMN